MKTMILAEGEKSAFCHDGFACKKARRMPKYFAKLAGKMGSEGYPRENRRVWLASNPIFSLFSLNNKKL